MKAIKTRKLLTAFLCAALALGSTVCDAAGFQRFRMSVGTYTIGSAIGGSGGGGDQGPTGDSSAGSFGSDLGSLFPGPDAGTSESRRENSPDVFHLPASCIEAGLSAPSDKDAIRGIAGPAYVERLDDQDGVAETRTLSAAVLGPDPWLRMHGNYSAASIDLEVVTPGKKFRIVVPDTTIVGPEQKGAAESLAAWNSHTNLKRVSETNDAVERDITSILGNHSPLDRKSVV